MEIKITVFTATYNRANTLPRLYHSLQQQTCMDFEWLVVDDGSDDTTCELFEQWTRHNNIFPINYLKIKNGGKNRAINKGVQIAKGKYFFIVDSDDFLLPEAVSYVLRCFSTLDKNKNFIGISTIRGGTDKSPLNGEPLIDRNLGYIDCNNLDRYKYNLSADMAEVFFTEKLKLYPFPVWKGEKFTPEAVIWDRMALDGYILRWYNKVIYLCEYQNGGLSASSWRLLRDNPMGYAMLYNIRLEYTKNIRMIINYALQYIVCCCLANKKMQILRCVKPILSIFLFPVGFVLFLRRKMQITKYVR